LHDLTLTAQVRNEREGITGLLLYDEGRFFQWLEGSAESLKRLMDSIRRDSRHVDVQVLRDCPTPSRRFTGWSLKLAAMGAGSVLWRQDVTEPPIEVIEGLRRRPDAAPAFLVGLVSVPTSRAPTWDGEPTSHLPMAEKTAAVLKNVFLSAVMPLLGVANANHLTGQPPAAHPLASELAELLVAADGDAARELIAELEQGAGAIGSLAASLLEPAARSLGDLWREDFCSEFDVTLGLCRLQSAVRLLSSGSARNPASHVPRPAVLIAPEPGELHRLGAMLDSTVLQTAGWSDVLDLSLSPAFRREHDLPRVTRTIAEARRASRNPALVVVVGGRVFLEEKSAGLAVGADHANSTSLNVNRTILRTMSETRTNTTSVSETLQVTATAS
jgi:methanogenic corrinoid protein MtbC1